MSVSWVDQVCARDFLNKHGLLSLVPEEIAHVTSQEHSAAFNEMTETWPVSLELEDFEETSDNRDETSSQAVREESFLMSIAPSVRKKNLSMVQGRNDWISKPDGSIEPMNAKKWHILDRQETRSTTTAGDAASVREPDAENGDESDHDDGIDDEDNEPEEDGDEHDVDDDDEDDEEDDDVDDADDADDDERLNFDEGLEDEPASAATLLVDEKTNERPVNAQLLFGDWTIDKE